MWYREENLLEMLHVLMSHIQLFDVEYRRRAISQLY